MKRAPAVCSYWPDGIHGDVRVRIRYGFLWLRARTVSVCVRCDGYVELAELRESLLVQSLKEGSTLFPRVVLPPGYEPPSAAVVPEGIAKAQVDNA